MRDSLKVPPQAAGDSDLLSLSVVIVNWNTRDLLKNCLQSVISTALDLSWEAIVVDNASTDGSAEMVQAEFPAVRLISNRVNRGFAAANNQAFALMRGRYALLLNSDALLTEGSLQALFSFMEDHREAGMAAGQLLNADGSRQNSIAAFPTITTLLLNMSLLEILWPRRYPGKRYDHPAPREVDSVIGACMIVRKDAMDAVGWFDERYFFFFEETDWACRMRQAGWKVFHVPAARIYHLQGQSVGHRLPSRIAFYRSRYRYFQKWRRRPIYLLLRGIVLFRLIINWLLTSAGVSCTLGLNRHLRDRWLMYSGLLLWHLKGDRPSEEPLSNQEVRRVLMIQLGDVGDVVWATPAFRAVKDFLGGGSLSLLVREGCRSLLAADPAIDQIYEVAHTEGKGDFLYRMRDELALIRSLRRARFDAVIDLRADDRGAFTAFLAGAPIRAAGLYGGPSRWRNRLFTRLIPVSSRPPGILGAAEQSLSILRGLGIPTPGTVPRIYPAREAIAKAGVLLGEKGLEASGFVTINPFSRWTYKEWGDDGWRQLSGLIWKTFSLPAVMVGSPAERGRAENLITSTQGPLINLAGRTNLGDLAALLAQSRLHLGVDSAAPHIAAAVGTPTVTIFGPSDWRDWAPVGTRHRVVLPEDSCVPCRQKGCDHSGRSRCLETLTISRVWGAVEAALREITDKQ
ncbi:MAG: glycosyltransferase family 9 protein [Smithellaceae bacterium]|nr:glycosyltransferase family 9 protein [Smithellaceae bacterium]